VHPREFNINNWGQPPFNRKSFQHIQSLFPTTRLRRGDQPIRLQKKALRDLSKIRVPNLEGGETSLESMLRDSFTDAFLVMKDGIILAEEYFNGMSPSSFHLLNSVSKSFLGVLIGILSHEDILRPEDAVTKHLPELQDTAFRETSIQQALDMTGAVKYDEDYMNPLADFWKETAVVGWRPELVENVPKKTLFEFTLSLAESEQDNGTKFDYRTVFTNVLAMAAESAAGVSLQNLLEEKLWQKLGTEQDAAIVVDSSGFPYMGAGMNACTRDLARFGQMIAQGGLLNGEQIVPSAWINDLVKGNQTLRSLFEMSDYGVMRPGGHYHNQFWVSAPEDQTLMCIGIHGQFIHINISNQTVIVKLSSQPEPANTDFFLEAGLVFDALSHQI
jgi:CubicO group peptidase (beta-lactamase class C family)